MAKVLTINELNAAMDDAAELIMMISVLSENPKTVIRDALVAAYLDGTLADKEDA